ncbi:MAG: aldehyde ferredoxin oxidoreductase family protein [Dehalococcoidia bacterium]|nr:aldehyde ferredoxin oxidoreductase family protein [Dehalococcoidia bacterium]
MRKLLRVNLSSEAINEEAIPDRIALDYVGGRGFGAKYLYDEVPAGTDPLGNKNKLLLVTGPLAGTNAQSVSKWVVITKSPVTNTFTRSYGGGDFGAWLKWAGLEMIVLEGKASKPSYLYIKDNKYEILDAADIWGKTTSQTQDVLRKRHGARVRTVCIGPAAEKMVLYAAIITGRRAAGRGGTGTVMASKNLKAIVVEAQRKDQVADPAEFGKLVKQQVSSFKSGLGFGPFRDYGTVMGVDFPGFSIGTFPVRNFRSAALDGWQKISFMQYAAITQKHSGCYACMLRCGKTRTVAEGPYAGVTTEGPQYETVWAFSGPTACADLGATVKADRMCCELGLDTISTGNTIGFAYELFEKGILTTRDTGGLVLRYGDPEPMIKLIDKIGYRHGIGDILAEGVKRAAQRIGKGSEQYAMHVKGLEMPGYEPRSLKALGMNYALSNMGANHCYGYSQQEMGNPRPRLVDAAADEGKGDIVKYNHDFVAAVELVNACTFATHNLELFGLEIIGQMLLAALGESKYGSADYLWHAGEKVYNLERCFNIREGFARKDDALPARMHSEPLQGGLRDGELYRKPDAIIDEYYKARGWDQNGIPTGETLAALGLSELDRDIARFRT